MVLPRSPKSQGTKTRSQQKKDDQMSEQRNNLSEEEDNTLVTTQGDTQGMASSDIQFPPQIKDSMNLRFPEMAAGGAVGGAVGGTEGGTEGGTDIIDDTEDYTDKFQQIINTTMALALSKFQEGIKETVTRIAKSAVQEAIGGEDLFEGAILDRLSELDIQEEIPNTENTQARLQTGTIPKQTLIPVRSSGNIPSRSQSPRHGKKTHNKNRQINQNVPNNSQRRSGQAAPENPGHSGRSGNHQQNWRDHPRPPHNNARANNQNQGIRQAVEEPRAQPAEEQGQIYHPRDPRPRVMEYIPPEPAPRQAGTVNGDSKTIRGWGLKFSGDRNSMPVGDFLFRIENLRQRYQVERQQILDNFHLLIEGKADEFYWEIIRSSQARGIPVTWDGLKRAFIGRYEQSTSELDVMREMMDLKQARDESFDSVHTRFSRLHNRLLTPLSERAMVELLRSSLKEETAQLLCITEINTVDQLRHLVSLAEKQQKLRRRQYGPPPGRLAEIEVVEELDREQETEGIPQRGYSRPLNPQAAASWTCWNCREKGHGFLTCERERKIFCYRCGEPEVTFPRCPKCKKGNSRANGRRNGQSHLRATGPLSQLTPPNPSHQR